MNVSLNYVSFFNYFFLLDVKITYIVFGFFQFALPSARDYQPSIARLATCSRWASGKFACHR